MKKDVLPNHDHDIADVAGMDRENLYGWQVIRGQTKVKLKDGTTGTIIEWFGGYMVLDNSVKSHRDEITEVITL